MLRARRPHLELTEDAVPRHWFAGSVVMTHVANGMNMLFPAGERFFMRSVAHYAARIEDPTLRAEVRGFFGQEGQHARAHEQDFARLRAQGYAIDGFLRVYERIVYGVLEKVCPPALNLASTAACEHFTAILAEGALEGGVLDDAHPTMRALLLWHAAEEIEHKHVAFDVLAAMHPSYPLRIAGLALATVNLATFWVLGALTLLAQERPNGRALAEELRRLRTRRPMVAGVFVRGIREYLRPGFHPRDNDNYALAAEYLQQVGLEGQAVAA